MIIQIPYGASHLPIETRAVNLVGVYTPRSSAPAPDPAAAIRAALGSPVAGPRLREAARGSRSAMILVDDVTRETPAHLIVPAILEELAAGGLPADGVRVMIALGTHRPMSSAEVRRKLGADVLRDVEVLQHDHRNVALEDLGRTPDGTPISLNRDVLEADLVIGTGSVVPHHVAGFSAGAKIVQPGVSGASTTAATHMFSARAGTPLLGQVDSTVRREMESIAERAGMRQVLNVTLNSDGRLVSAHFGATKPAFRRAVDDARRIYGVPAAGELDIVIAGSHPCDIEFWQAHKSLYPAVMMTRRNGTIILVTPCPEGVAVTHQDLLGYAARPVGDIVARAARGEIADQVAAALAVAWARVREHARVVLVSDGISAQDARALGFEKADDVESALRSAAKRYGASPSVGVLTHAPETLPLRN